LPSGPKTIDVGPVMSAWVDLSKFTGAGGVELVPVVKSEVNGAKGLPAVSVRPEVVWTV
jgi:hypothetical protein